jgi:hypothetical protein
VSGIIRKITIGKDYKDAMHYSLKQEVWDGFRICMITDIGDEYEILIRKDGGVRSWKKFNKNMGISIEYDIEDY